MRGIRILGGGYRRKVGLLRHGSIPDYYPQFDTDGAGSKRQKISALTDYEVIPLALGNYDTGPQSTKYIDKIITPNRRRALVVLKLSDEAMRNCQSIIDKVGKHPNVGYIIFGVRGGYYPCAGTYLGGQKVYGAYEFTPLLKNIRKNVQYSPTKHYQEYFLLSTSPEFRYSIDLYPLIHNLGLVLGISSAKGLAKNLIVITYDF